MTLRAKVAMDEYLAMPAIGSGTLHTLITKSPYHAWFGSYLNPIRPREESETMDAGTIAHSLLLEGDESKLAIIQADDWRTKAAKELRDIAYAAGQIPILERKLPPIREMVKVAKAYVESSEIAGIFGRGQPEVVGTWKEGDALMRLRADFLADDHSIILDYKSTATNAEPNAVIRHLLGSGYDIQNALYCRGLEAITGKLPRFLNLFQENEPPFACSLIGLAPSLLDLADRKVQTAINHWKACLKAGEWPCYPTRIAWAEAPAWAVAQFEDWLGDPPSDEEIGLISGTGTFEANPEGIQP